MSIILRVDDFPGSKPDEFWKHNLENFRKFHDVLEKRGIKYVLGVIPKYVTQEQIQFLVEKKDWITVAMHGARHDERYANEFHFETREQTKDLIDACLDKLFLLLPINTYIPPHNVIDSKTCDVLKEFGFNRILGGPGTSDFVMNYAQSIGLEMHVSTWPMLYGRSDELLIRDRAHEFINKTYGKNALYLPTSPAYLTIHWPWEFNIGLEHLERFLDSLEPGILSSFTS